MFKIIPKVPSRGEELGNFITHTVGTLLAIAGLVLLIVKAVHTGNVLRIFSFTVFGSTLVLLYVASSLYHGLPLLVESAKLAKVLRILDHSSIFLLIAGTYTPFSLVTLRNSRGILIFAAIWTIAAIGIVVKAVFIGKFPVLFTALYVAMGWFVLFDAKALVKTLPVGGLWLLFLGGFFYTFGVIFYAAQKLKFNHFVWHFFVILGSACHYFSILFFV